MARLGWIVAVFGAWLAVLTLLPLYLVMSGRYSLVGGSSRRSGASSRNQRTAGDVQWEGGVDLMKRGARRTADERRYTSLLLQDEAVDSVQSAGSSFQAELEKILSLDESDPRAVFDQVVALSSLLPKLENISRFRTPSPEAFRNYIAPMGLPVIFTDLFDGEMLRQWSWEYIKSKWGSTVFYNTRQGDYSNKTTLSGKHYVNRVSVSLADFIDVVTGKKEASDKEKGLYITKQRIIPVEALEAEFYYPPFYPAPHKKCYLEPTGWIGSPGTFTQGHIDSKDNFVYQIIGQKRWTIFSPVDYKHLYYTQTRGSLEWSSALNSLQGVDLARYPLYAKTSPITFTMQPGEVLYLPRGWTHFVENVTPALMINTWRYGPAAITEYWSEKNRKELRQKCY